MAVNAWNEPKAELAKFAKKEKLKHKILLNGEDVFNEKYGLGSIGVPTMFWIDPKGVIVDVDLDFKGPGPLERKTASLVKRSG